MKKSSLDLTGKIFGEWTVLYKDRIDSKYKHYWFCKCTCGVIKSIEVYRLLDGTSVKCRSCFVREQSTVHGKYYSPEYKCWAAMLSRCNNIKNPKYKDYGKRGIMVCDRWKEFMNFYEDLGDRPSTSHSLDRIDVNGNYEPNNCRWATRSQQGKNRRKANINSSSLDYVTFNSKTNRWMFVRSFDAKEKAEEFATKVVIICQ